MELHEFGVGDAGAGARREGERRAGRLGRIGGDGVKPADPAAGEHGRARGESVEGARGVAAVNAGHAAGLDDQILGDDIFDHFDGRRLPDLGDQRLHDGGAGAVALHPHDAPRRMGGFARGGQTPLGVAVEWRAEAQKIVDPRAGLADDGKSDLFVD